MEMKCSPFVDTQPRPPLERVDPPLSSFSRSFPFFSLYKIHTYIRSPHAIQQSNKSLLLRGFSVLGI
ncbi:hypothetical protein L2E82_37017 [Cichorium intybus]|uniref:Uncharacterized protein n=1 Tax=Cichorium intybus TaxID=13427 RepID=A0ACB9ADJ2_CICIN|nr:hypothetical protein L2E82_37017 [Cichorium intybus]